MIENKDYQQWAVELNGIWKQLGRQVRQKIVIHPTYVRLKAYSYKLRCRKVLMCHNFLNDIHWFQCLIRSLFPEAGSESFTTGKSHDKYIYSQATPLFPRISTIFHSLPSLDYDNLYRDSYWIVRGLLLCNMTETAKNMILNMVSLVER